MQIRADGRFKSSSNAGVLQETSPSEHVSKCRSLFNFLVRALSSAGGSGKKGPFRICRSCGAYVSDITSDMMCSNAGVIKIVCKLRLRHSIFGVGS